MAYGVPPYGNNVLSGFSGFCILVCCCNLCVHYVCNPSVGCSFSGLRTGVRVALMIYYWLEYIGVARMSQDLALRLGVWDG